MTRHLLPCIVFALCLPTVASAERLPATPRSLPLADLNQDEIETYVNENVSIADGATQTILNASPGTPGYASSIWMTAESGPFMRQAILDVYVDGESTPSVTTDLAGLGTCASNTSGHWGTENVVIETQATNQPWEQQRYDITFRFPIPFKNSINITITNHTGSPVNFWSVAHYATGRNVAQKLWSAGRTETNRLKNLTPLQQGDGSVHFLKLASGAGVVVYHSMCWENWGGGTPNFLENNPVMYLDRRRPGAGILPQVDSSGTEDYFRSAFYFMTNTIYDKYASAFQGYNASNGFFMGAAMDFYSYNGGIKFNDGILMRWEKGQRPRPGTSAVNVDLSWLVLYYTPY